MAQKGRKPSVNTPPKYLNRNTVFYDASEDVIKQMRKLSKKALRAGAKVAAKSLKSAAPVRTGNLKNAAGLRVRVLRGQPVSEVGFFNKKNAIRHRALRASNFLPNPTWFEFGSRPHKIRPGIWRGDKTGKRSLSNSHELFMKLVNHPGTKGEHFMANALKAHVGDIRQAQMTNLALLYKKLDELHGIKEESDSEDGERA